MSIRTERMGSEVHQALGRLFQTEFASFADGMITVSKVKMAPDLRSARVYLSVFGGTVSTAMAVSTAKVETPHIRSALAHEVRMRYVPELYFYADDTQDEVAKIEELLRKLPDHQ